MQRLDEPSPRHPRLTAGAHGRRLALGRRKGVQPRTAFAENILSLHPLPERGSKRLNARDAPVLLLWIAVALAGVTVAHRYFFQAFPEAAVNFKVTRAAALERARAFVIAPAKPLQGYQSTVVFSVDDDGKTYLEREVGLAQANRLMSSEVRVWYWNIRFFRPQQKEEFRVRITPDGQVAGYEHILEESAPGARLERAQALQRAEDFLTQTLHTDLGTYTFLPEEANSLARPNRTDWSFTWERTGFRAKDAPYRLRVTVQGGDVGGYQEFLKVPEVWLRSYERLRSSNNFIETLALIPYAVLLGAALSVLTILGRRGLTRWAWALKLGLFIAALYFIMQLNQWPLVRAGYDTNDSYSSFVAMALVKALATSILLSLLVVIAVVPGEPLYRMGQPDHLRLESVFTFPGLRTKEFFCSGMIGVCLAGAHIGFVVLFYVLGQRFGVWAPQDLQYSDTLSTALPWIFPLTIGIYAAVSEEFLFRMFSIRFLLRATRWKFLAVVLPAFAWGFLHSNYPQEPPYIRGIEVGLIGIVAGLVMLRWGILATLTWHYTVDAFLSSLSLLRAGDIYSRVSGAIVGFGALIPIAIAGVLYLSRGGFGDDTALVNRAQPLVETPVQPREQLAAEPPVASYEPLGKRAMGALLLGAVLGAGLVWAVRPQRIGDFVKFPLDAYQAEARADDVLRQSGVNPAGYRRAAVTRYTFDPLANEYLRRTIGIEATNRLYRDEVPAAFWAVRYFRDSQREEYLVVLLPDGKTHSLRHTLAEETPGPTLTKEEALAGATDYLRGSKGVDFSQWTLVEAQSAKLPARTDHSFTWEQTKALNPTPAGPEGAHLRIELKIQGAEVSGYRIFIHLPEEWVRKQNQGTLVSTAQAIGLGGLLFGFGVAVLVVFFQNLKNPDMIAVPWRRLAGLALAVLIASLVNSATLGPQYLLAYRTDIPFITYLGTILISLILIAALFYSAAVFLFGLAWFFLGRSGGNQRLPLRRSMPETYYRDAILVGVCGSAILAGAHRLADVLARVWPVARHSFPASVPTVLDARWPSLHVLAGGVMYSLIGIGVLALALGFASRYLRPTWLQAVLLALLAVFLVPRWGSAGEFIQSAAVAFLQLTVIWWGARRVVRLNLAGYFLWAMLLTLVPAIEELGRQPNSFFRANMFVLMAAAAVLLCWPFISWQREARRRARAGNTAVPI
jgi:membrane protease YdiL (CAAX protease family)